jgi:hypothetical protein
MTGVPISPELLAWLNERVDELTIQFRDRSAVGSGVGDGLRNDARQLAIANEVMSVVAGFVASDAQRDVLTALVGAIAIERLVVSRSLSDVMFCIPERARNFPAVNLRLDDVIANMRLPDMPADEQWARTAGLMIERAEESPNYVRAILEIAVAAFMRLAGRSDEPLIPWREHEPSREDRQWLAKMTDDDRSHGIA